MFNKRKIKINKGKKRAENTHEKTNKGGFVLRRTKGVKEGVEWVIIYDKNETRKKKA